MLHNFSKEAFFKKVTYSIRTHAEHSELIKMVWSPFEAFSLKLLDETFWWNFS